MRKAQEEIKQQADKGRREVEIWKKRDKIMLSTKDLVFRERLTNKLMERYVRPYMIEEIVSRNVVKLRLLVSMRIHPVVNVSRVVRYRESEKGQKVEEPKPVEVDGVEKWEVEKILNKRKVREVMKYLVWWKRFTAENNTWEKEKDLENARKLVNKFEGRMGAEIRRQEGIKERWKVKLNPKANEFRRSKLLGKYTVKILFEWNNRKFENEYLKKLERNWQRWKLVSLEEKP